VVTRQRTAALHSLPAKKQTPLARPSLFLLSPSR
jgi:hypothetical protein